MPAKNAVSPEAQLKLFIGKFTPEMGRKIRAARKGLRELLPGATELVYDNYNFFVIGYGPSERTSEAVFSLAAQASGLTLFFLQGVGLPDPERLLQGAGNKVRSVKLADATDLKSPRLLTLIKTACRRAKVPLKEDGRPRLIVKSVSAKQRPRRAEAR
jgi:Domain of unknown function (DU1801)